MKTERKSSLVMLVLLCVSIFIYNFGAGIYHASGIEPLATFEFLFHGIFLCGVVWWLRADAGTSAIHPVYCSGLLVGYGWLFMIPYHLLETRGLRGFIPLLALIGSYLLGNGLAVVVYMMFLS